MSDDQSQESPTDTSSSADGPGGGPQRVVSEQSVDDILDSLSEPADEPADSSDIDDTPIEDDVTASTADNPQKSDETPLEGDEQTDESTAAGDSSDTDASSSEPSNNDSDGDDGNDVSDNNGGDGGDNASNDDDTNGTQRSENESSDDGENSSDGDSTDSDAGSDDTDDDERSDSSTALSQTGSVESVNEDTSIDDLAARIERGDVTGSDVRAAEAGDGRESTRDVGEIDLSMDDLESTQATSGASPTASTDSAADDGPLAGSINPNSADSSDDEKSESAGFLGRIKRFFGG
ncbi:hypothetical protein SAMN04487967_1658 [Natronorubrum sediminis]|uniref:Uncharacterized protein n=1 Tax=Natronorubrum sediminis TaxID=640943 RepID=A0A1H6FUV1_9EURY|nr:hypothetical protein [Natronorubrum sediminis]SEH14557.1 hypothetical protein SAMN04487967_1658 [Natronorubrum sediminis]